MHPERSTQKSHVSMQANGTEDMLCKGTEATGGEQWRQGRTENVLVGVSPLEHSMRR